MYSISDVTCLTQVPIILCAWLTYAVKRKVMPQVFGDRVCELRDDHRTSTMFFISYILQRSEFNRCLKNVEYTFFQDFISLLFLKITIHIVLLDVLRMCYCIVTHWCGYYFLLVSHSDIFVVVRSGEWSLLLLLLLLCPILYFFENV